MPFVSSAAPKAIKFNPILGSNKGMTIENMAYESGGMVIKEEMFVKEESMDDESTKEEEGSALVVGDCFKCEDDAIYLVLDHEERNLKDEVDYDKDYEQLDELRPRKRRRKSTSIILPEETERILGEWLEFKVPFIYDKGDYRHKKKELIDSVWMEKGASLEPPVSAQDLKTWFSSLRSRFGRLSKEESEAGSRRLTCREKWIMTTFSFLKPHIVRQRNPRPQCISKPVADDANPRHSPAPAPGCEPEPTPFSDPAPGPESATDPDTDDVDDPSAGFQEHNPPAKSKPERMAKERKPPGAVPAVTAQRTKEQVLKTVKKLSHNVGGVMDMVKELEMKYWSTSLEIMAKDCVGLPASYNTALKMELLAAIERFRNAHVEGVAKPGPDLMLHAYRNFGSPAPQPQQPHTQQQHAPPPADTVAGVQRLPVLYQGTSATQSKPAASFNLPALQSLLQQATAATPSPNHLPSDASAPTSSQLQQPHAQQQHPPPPPPPADTVAGVRRQPVLYQGTSATEHVPIFNLRALRSLLQQATAATTSPNHLPSDASRPTSSLSQFDLSQFDLSLFDLSQFASSSVCKDLMAGTRHFMSSCTTGMPTHYGNASFESQEDPQKEQ